MAADLIQQLETYRLENKITQEGLADMLGVDFTTVNRWLNGKNMPNKILQYHIKKFLNQRNGRLSNINRRYHESRKDKKNSIQ